MSSFSLTILFESYLVFVARVRFEEAQDENGIPREFLLSYWDCVPVRCSNEEDLYILEERFRMGWDNYFGREDNAVKVSYSCSTKARSESLDDGKFSGGTVAGIVIGGKNHLVHRSLLEILCPSLSVCVCVSIDVSASTEKSVPVCVRWMSGMGVVNFSEK